MAKSGETDKFIREFRRNSSEHVAAKAKITDKALERLEAKAVEKPWESWDLRLEIAAAPRGGAVVTQLTGAVVQRGTFTLGPVDLEIRYGERVGLLGANGSGKTTLLDAMLGRIPLAAVTRTWVPAWSWASSIKRAPRSPVRSRCSSASRSRAVCSPAKPGRCSRSSGSPPTTCCGRPTPAHRASERARRSRCSRRGASTASCSTSRPTTSISPQSSSSSKRSSPTPARSLLVTHDRSLLDAVALTRRVELADGRLTSDQVLA